MTYITRNFGAPNERPPFGDNLNLTPPFGKSCRSCGLFSQGIDSFLRYREIAEGNDPNTTVMGPLGSGAGMEEGGGFSEIDYNECMEECMEHFKVDETHRFGKYEKIQKVWVEKWNKAFDDCMVNENTNPDSPGGWGSWATGCLAGDNGGNVLDMPPTSMPNWSGHIPPDPNYGAPYSSPCAYPGTTCIKGKCGGGIWAISGKNKYGQDKTYKNPYSNYYEGDLYTGKWVNPGNSGAYIANDCCKTFRDKCHQEANKVSPCAGGGESIDWGSHSKPNIWNTGVGYELCSSASLCDFWCKAQSKTETGGLGTSPNPDAPK